MKYSLFRTADFQQEEIWRYTYQLWGKEQADRYIAELHNAISEATKNRYLWRKLSTGLVDLKISIWLRISTGSMDLNI